MTTPTNPEPPASAHPPASPQPAATPQPAEAAFSATLKGGPTLLRVAVVAAAAMVLLVSAALTFGASPKPSTSAPRSVPEAGANGGPDLGLGGPGPGAPDFRFGPRGDRGGFGGITITGISGSNVSLTTDDGWTRTITVTGTTKLTKGGATIALVDLKSGDRIRFRQTRNTDGTFTIQAIEVVLPKVAGTVTSVSADGFTLKTRGNVSWTITVNGSTTYMLGGATGSKADVTVGTVVGVTGTQSTDTSLTATAVRIEVPRVFGKVTAKTADTITVERLGGGTATIHVGGGTTYRLPGKATASLSDIAIGAIIGAEGRQRADGSLDATVVAAGPRVGKLFGGRDGRSGLPKGAPNATPNATPGSYSAG